MGGVGGHIPRNLSLIWHVKLELRDLKEILMQPQEPYFSLKKKTILIILFYFFAN